MELGLTGKRVLLTGGTRGIGRAPARALAAEGMSVIACHRSAGEAATSLASRLKELGDGNEVVRADVTDQGEVTRLMERARIAFGGLDVLVNNVGVDGMVPFGELAEPEWHRVLDHNVTAAYLVTRASLDLLSDGASVINIGSSVALRGRVNGVQGCPDRHDPGAVQGAGAAADPGQHDLPRPHRDGTGGRPAACGRGANRRHDGAGSDRPARGRRERGRLPCRGRLHLHLRRHDQRRRRCLMARGVTVIGLGSMGSGMAAALVAAGLPVTVFNRTSAKAEPLVKAGASFASSAGAACDGAEVVLLSLSDESAVDDVLFGEAVERIKPGAVVIDASTVSPTFARNTELRLRASGIARVEACVLGNPQMALAGRLRVFAAGRQSDVDGVRDVLSALSQEIRYLGPTGRASTLKLAFNLLLGVQVAGLAEAVAFAEGAGLGRDLLLDAIDNSGWQSPVLSFRTGFMRYRKYSPAGFRATLMRKDLTLASEQARADGVELPLVDAAVARYD